MLERILIFSGAVFVYYVLIGLINLTRECRDRRSHLDFYFEVNITIAEYRDCLPYSKTASSKIRKNRNSKNDYR